MPNFAQAKISSQTDDLSEYRTFLRSLKVGQVVTLPLEEGETTRKVMRTLNSVAREHKVRLARISSPENAIKFRVMPAEKRAVNLTEEQRRTRAEKARATREARRQAQEQPE
jgi:hypothetical protein